MIGTAPGNYAPLALSYFFNLTRWSNRAQSATARAVSDRELRKKIAQAMQMLAVLEQTERALTHRCEAVELASTQLASRQIRAWLAWAREDGCGLQTVS